MFETLIGLCEGKEFKRYAWELFLQVRDGTLSMKALIELLLLLHQKELEAFTSDEDEWSYISRYTACDVGGTFALALLKKGIVDGRWSYENGAFSDGRDEVTMEQILRACDQAAQGMDEEDVRDVGNRFREMDSFDPRAERFRLALLDHINADNALVILGLLQGMKWRHLSSLQDLEQAQSVWPERFARDALTEEVAKNTYQSYCYFFLEQCDDQERAEADDASNRIRRARTVAEAVFAEVEYTFWLQINTLFPCSAYQLVAGLMDDAELPAVAQTPAPGRTEIVDFTGVVDAPIDFAQDPRLTEEGQRILALASAGDADAQDTLSQMYLSGNGAPQDDRRAVHWMQLAAEQGVVNAQCNYGVALQRGLGGIEPNNAQAFKWLMAAAERDNPTAQLNVGLALAGGKGVPRDVKAGLEWIRKAADNGNEIAKLILETGLILNS